MKPSEEPAAASSSAERVTRSHVPRRANFELPSLRIASESVAGGKIEARPPRPREARIEISTALRGVGKRSTLKRVRLAGCVREVGWVVRAVRCGALQCGAVRWASTATLYAALEWQQRWPNARLPPPPPSPTIASRAPASGCSPTPRHHRPLYSLCFCVTAATDADCSTAAHPIASFHSTAARIVCTSTASYGCCARAASTRLHLRLAPRPFTTKRSRIPSSRLSPYHHIPSSIDSSSQNVLEARQE
ncbi:hypothetical protein L1887_54513 [Cichorium endivia]|nr:hypothetical protein L1887_54513 [Cichorium endivia]